MSPTSPLPTTAWSREFGIIVPIACAPMGGAAGGRLASAVSLAGGLGMIGMGSAGSVPLLERELALLDPPVAAGPAPFGIGLVDWVWRQDPALLERALEARPALLSVSFGERYEWAEAARAVGVVSAVQVANVDEARRAVDSGVEIIIARGAEGGGHGAPERALAPLLTAVLDAVNVPVLAAGGLSSARAVAAAIAAGASGAWVGTAFLACPEALFSPAARARILSAHASETVLTSAADAALGYPWPQRFPERVLRTDFTERWAGRVDELRVDPIAQAEFAAALAREDYSVVPLNAGQGVGDVTEILDAAAVLDRLSGY